MPLNDRQISDLARMLDSAMTLAELVQLADEVDVNLNNLAPDGSVKTRAETFLKAICSEARPRDRELLDLITRKGPTEISPAIKNLASELLKPSYFPPVDAHDAFLLGSTGFFGREALRLNVREFTNPSDYTTRVLVVRGTEPGGKSYSWQYLRHLALQIGAEPMHLRLKEKTLTPRELVEEVAYLLDLDVSTIPKLADNPQNMRMNAFLAWFQGRLVSLKRSYWLVIDDLNEPILPETRLCAYELAAKVEDKGSGKLWVALLGYNEPLTGMRKCVKDDATFPTMEMIARHFVALAAASPKSLSIEQARSYAGLLYSKFPTLDRDAMIELTELAEDLGAKLRLGLQP